MKKLIIFVIALVLISATFVTANLKSSRIQEIYPGRSDVVDLCNRRTERAICLCSNVQKPVCGIDNKTYENKCLARLAGVKALCKGDCPCEKKPVCGNGICEKGEVTLCPQCSFTNPRGCLTVCRAGTCENDCNSRLY